MIERGRSDTMFPKYVKKQANPEKKYKPNKSYYDKNEALNMVENLS